MIEVRPVRAADLAAVLALDQATEEAPHWSQTDYQALLAKTSDSPLRRAGFVASSGDDLLGFAAARLLLDGIENRCELESIVVARNSRRSGVGSQLLQAAIAWARRQGAHRLQLEVRAGNGPAISFYERAGMRREGLRPQYYAAPVEDALLMGMPLEASTGVKMDNTSQTVENFPEKRVE
jgi:ribosomal-protein-alanine N-acetyltransferase